MDYGIAVYLRNLAMRLDKIAGSCLDERTQDAIAPICLDLFDKAHVIETTFVIPKDGRQRPTMAEIPDA